MAYIQDTSNNTGGTSSASLAATLTGVRAGSTLLVIFTDDNDTGTDTVSVSDSVNGAFTQTANGYFRDTPSAFALSTWTRSNVSAGSHTVTCTPNVSTLMTMFLIELSAPSSNVVDGTPTAVTRNNPGAGANAITAPALTTFSPGSVIVSYCMSISVASTSFVPGTGFARSVSGMQSLLGFGFNVEYTNAGGPGSVTATWSDSVNGAANQYEVSAIAIRSAITSYPFNEDFGG